MIFGVGGYGVNSEMSRGPSNVFRDTHAYNGTIVCISGADGLLRRPSRPDYWFWCLELQTSFEMGGARKLALHVGCPVLGYTLDDKCRPNCLLLNNVR